MNERDPPPTTILQDGKNMLTTSFQTQQGFMGGKKIISFVYRYLDSALQINPIILYIPTYPTYRHRRFHIIYCKAQNRHLKVIKYTLKKYIYITKHWPHNCKYICWNVYIYTNTKNKPFFISTQKYYLLSVVIDILYIFKNTIFF